MKKIMKPGHPRWKEFIQKLTGPEGCDFRVEEDGRVTWLCNEDYKRPKTRAILKTMPEIDVKGSLDYLAEQGGCCDCEVIINLVGLSRIFSSQIKAFQKKAAEKKPAKKKDSEKKPAEKKPAQKKIAVKKPVEKKPVEKKPTQKKKTAASQRSAPSSKKAKNEKI